MSYSSNHNPPIFTTKPFVSSLAGYIYYQSKTYTDQVVIQSETAIDYTNVLNKPLLFDSTISMLTIDANLIMGNKYVTSDASITLSPCNADSGIKGTVSG